jgi:hypothetical protein
MAINLVKYLQSKQDILGSFNDITKAFNICMLSHIPFDWFICHELLANVQFLESYTGKIYNSDHLINKILSKDILTMFPGIGECIPFAPLTHLLFGDKYFVKGLLSKKEQKAIILVLLENYRHDPFRWVKDLNTLLLDLQQYLSLSPTTLMSLQNQGGSHVL